MNISTHKLEIAKTYTDDPSIIQTLLSYTENKFSGTLKEADLRRIPLADEPYAAVWSEYLAETEVGTTLFEVLKSKIIQFRFPVVKGISKSDAYRNATLKGDYVTTSTSCTGLTLNNPHLISLKIYQTIAGKIPILIIPDQEDFQSILQALLYKNEPVPIPQSMGAAMISGLNNWDRIAKYKYNWSRGNANGSWANEFTKNVVPRKEIYQDKLIVLSKKNYSNIQARQLHIDELKWLEYSLLIRLEHECAHFFTKRFLGCMSINLHDELIADYMGITKVAGKFRADWFFKFTGLEHYPTYRTGGRLENYTGQICAFAPAFGALTALIYNAALNVEKFDAIADASSHHLNKAIKLLTLCSVDLLSMSATEGAAQLISNHKKYLKQFA